MTIAMCLCDWTTLGGSNYTSLVQSAETYADLLGCKDVTCFLDVAEVTNAPYLYYETSPTPDTTLFQSMTLPFFATVGVTTTVLRYETALTPLARYFRWRLQGIGGGAFSMTFRIWLACNMSGNARRNADRLHRAAHAGASRPASTPSFEGKTAEPCCNDCGEPSGIGRDDGATARWPIAAQSPSINSSASPPRVQSLYDNAVLLPSWIQSTQPDSTTALTSSISPSDVPLWPDFFPGHTFSHVSLLPSGGTPNKPFVARKFSTNPDWWICYLDTGDPAACTDYSPFLVYTPQGPCTRKDAHEPLDAGGTVCRCVYSCDLDQDCNFDMVNPDPVTNPDCSFTCPEAGVVEKGFCALLTDDCFRDVDTNVCRSRHGRCRRSGGRCPETGACRCTK